MADEVSLTEQLQRFSRGDQAIAEAVLREVMPRLHEIAVRRLGQERYVAPVSPTELINEVWLKSVREGGWAIRDREHFYAIAAHAMRQVLVDLARRRLALSRGAGHIADSFEHVDKGEHPSMASAEQVVEMGLLLDQLGKKDPAAARMVEMHVFAGYTLDEVAELTGLSLRRVRYLWGKGRNWLQDRLGG